MFFKIINSKYYICSNIVNDGFIITDLHLFNILINCFLYGNNIFLYDLIYVNNILQNLLFVWFSDNNDVLSNKTIIWFIISWDKSFFCESKYCINWNLLVLSGDFLINSLIINVLFTVFLFSVINLNINYSILKYTSNVFSDSPSFIKGKIIFSINNYNIM